MAKNLSLPLHRQLVASGGSKDGAALVDGVGEDEGVGDTDMVVDGVGDDDGMTEFDGVAVVIDGVAESDIDGEGWMDGVSVDIGTTLEGAGDGFGEPWQ